jgi:hypothetical protein
MFARLSLLAFLVVVQLHAIPYAIAPNGSFEQDTNRDGLPDGWKPSTFESPGKAVWDHAVARTGKFSARLSDSLSHEGKDWKDNVVRWVLQDSVEVTPGQTVTAEAWLKSELTAGDARVTLAWFAERKWLHEDSSEKANGSQDWTLHTVTAKAPKDAKYVSVYLGLNFAKGKVWFDDVQTSRGAKPAGNFRPIDLRTACNTGFRDDVAGDGRGGWTDQGDNDLRNIKPGTQTLRGIPLATADGPASSWPAGDGRTWRPKPRSRSSRPATRSTSCTPARGVDVLAPWSRTMSSPTRTAPRSMCR